MPDSTTILKIQNISKSFGSQRVFRDLSLQVKAGEVLALIGPNGSGKSTIADIISGLQKPDSGEIWLSDLLITNLSVQKRVLLGLSRSFQYNGTFANLTVRENLLIPVLQKRQWWQDFFLFNCQKYDMQIGQITQKYLLDKHLDKLAINLSGGQQKLLELCRLELEAGKLIILDEPLAGVNSQYFSYIQTFIGQMQQRGKAVILIEHNQDFVKQVATRVLDLGN